MRLATPRKLGALGLQPRPMPELTGYLERFVGKAGASGSGARRFSFSLVTPTAKWEKKYFVAYTATQVLAFYKTAEDALSNSKPAQGTVLCAGCVVNADPNSSTTFSIAHSDKVIYLKAAGGEERKAWMDACKLAGCKEGVVEGGDSARPASGMAGAVMKQTKSVFSSSWESRFLVVRNGTASLYKTESDAFLLAGNKSKPAILGVALAGSRVEMVAKADGAAEAIFALIKGDKVRACRVGMGAHELWVLMLCGCAPPAWVRVPRGTNASRVLLHGRALWVSHATGRWTDASRL